MDNYANGMALNRHSLDMSPCFEDRMSLADIDFPALAEHYYLESDSAFNDPANLFPWDSTNDRFGFDLPADSMNVCASSTEPKGTFYPNKLAERSLSCGSIFSDLESDAGSLSLVPSGNSLSPVLSDLDSEFLQTQTPNLKPVHASSFLRNAPPNTPEQVALGSPDSQTTMSPNAMSEVDALPSPALKPQTRSSKSTSSKTPQRTPRSSTSEDTKDTKDTTASKRKAAHNAVEKRYRTNMNAKFLALGDAIPSLRASKPNNSMNSKGIKTNLKDGTPTQNKSEVLTKALAYIQELQEEKYLLRNEINVLKDNLMPGGIWRNSRRREA